MRATSKRPSLLRRPLLSGSTGKPRFAFFRETIAELKKVTWPTWLEARNLTVVVIVVSVAVGFFLGVVDWFFNLIITEVFLR